MYRAPGALTCARARFLTTPVPRCLTLCARMLSRKSRALTAARMFTNESTPIFEKREFFSELNSPRHVRSGLAHERMCECIRMCMRVLGQSVSSNHAITREMRLIRQIVIENVVDERIVLCVARCHIKINRTRVLLETR